MSVPMPAHLQIFVADEIHGRGGAWLVSLHGGYGWTETHATPFRKLALFMVSVVVVVAVGVGGLLGAELRSSQRKPD